MINFKNNNMNKLNTASYRCNDTGTIIGYSTSSELPETITRGELTLVRVK